MKKSVILGISVLFFWSCNNSGKTETHQEEAPRTEVQTEHHHNESFDTIEFNNGEKWKVTDEMRPFVLKGADLVNTFIQTESTDYTTLAAELKDLNNQLIKSCTMTGKSHDELHKWLHPHLELVEELDQAPDENQAKTSVQKLAKSYQKYYEYFQ